jgi:hypothetical protein
MIRFTQQPVTADSRRFPLPDKPFFGNIMAIGK